MGRKKSISDYMVNGKSLILPDNFSSYPELGVTVRAMFCLFSPCPHGFPMGSLVPTHFPKTCLDWLSKLPLDVNVCPCCHAMDWCPTQGIFPHASPSQLFIQSNISCERRGKKISRTKCRLLKPRQYQIICCSQIPPLSSCICWPLPVCEIHIQTLLAPQFLPQIWISHTQCLAKRQQRN